MDQAYVFANINKFYHTIIINGFEYNAPIYEAQSLFSLYYFAEDYLEDNLDYVKYY